MNIEEGEFYIMKLEASNTATVFKAHYTKDNSVILIPLYSKKAKINTETGDIELDTLAKQQKRLSFLIQRVPDLKPIEP
jgi:hypothetical protein